MTQIIDERRGATSASNAQYDADCSARHLRQRPIPEEPASEDASYGRKIHRLLSGEQQTGEMAELKPAEREMFDACRNIEKAMVRKVFGETYPAMRVIREQRFWCKVPDGNGGFFEHSGQPDVIFRSGTKALICEYKVLKGDIPEAAENLQLRDQAVLVRGNLPMLDEIWTVPIQPLVTHSPEPCRYDSASLARAEREMFDRVRKSNDPMAQATPSDRGCKFCRAKLVCSEYNRWAGSMVPGMLTILDVPVASWTPEQRVAYCNGRSIAKRWLATCDLEMERILEKDPEAIPGYYLKPGAKKETIIDPQTVFARFAQLGGKVEQFMEAVAVGKTKLKGIVSKVTGAKGKDLEAAMKTITDGLTVTKQNKPSLARAGESDESGSE